MCVCGLRKPNLQIINLKLEMFWGKRSVSKKCTFLYLNNYSFKPRYKMFLNNVTKMSYKFIHCFFLRVMKFTEHFL